MSRWFQAGLVIVALISLAGCSFNRTVNENSEASTNGSETLSVVSSDPVSLKIQSNVGSIQIRSGADNEVKVDYIKTAYAQTVKKAQDELADVTVSIQQDGNQVTINTVQQAHTQDPRTNKVDLTITVPANVALDIVNEVGDVTLNGLTVPSALTVRNDVGNITLDGVTVQAGMLLLCNVGDVRFSGEIGDLGMYTLSSDVGSIAVTIPTSTSALVDVAAQVGSIKLDDNFAMSDKNAVSEDVRATLKGTLGEGTVPLNVRTNIGNVSLNPR